MILSVFAIMRYLNIRLARQDKILLIKDACTRVEKEESGTRRYYAGRLQYFLIN